MNKLILWVIVLTTVLNSCGSQKNLSPNNLYRQIVEIVRTEKPSAADISFVRNNYPSLISSLERDAATELESESRFKWKNALSIYTRLQSLNALMLNSGTYWEVLEKKDYSSQIEEMRISAAGDILVEATEALSSGTREGAKTAYFQLLEVKELSDGKVETSTLQKEALEIAQVDAAVFVDSTNQLGLNLDSVKSSILDLLLSPGIGGPFIGFEEYNIEADPDHLIEIKLENYVTGQIIKDSYSQPVVGSSTEFDILEESIDVVFHFRIRITDIALNRVLDNSTIKITRKLENLVGSYRGNPEDLNDYQESLIRAKPMEGHPEHVLSHIHTAVIRGITEEILDFYLNY